MLDPAIDAFFTEKKEGWLKKNIKQSMDDMKVLEKQEECEQLFSLNVWLPKAAKRAGQMSMATHPCTFSHPSARKNKNGYVSPVIATSAMENDGFLRSGNADVETDALGNAAVLDVYKFLSLTMHDSRKLIEHIREDSVLARETLSISSETYENLKRGFLSMTEADNTTEVITSSRIKQVYFPVMDDYHQLSLLSNSGLIYELKKRITILRFSEKIQELRKKRRENEQSDEGFSELFALVTIGYGGTKPQNISVLNNQNGGKAHLLLAEPPKIYRRKINFPKQNFFGESLRYYECRDIFEALHKLFKTNYNNRHIREGRDYRLEDLLDRIIDRMWAVRAIAEESYRPETSRLKPHQRTWLCPEFSQDREENDDWLNILCNEISRWAIHAYQKVLGKQAIMLDESVRKHIHRIVVENQEALR